MTAPDGFDRQFTAWLSEQAPMREPDGLLPTVSARIERTRRIPGWAILERWLPMQTTAKFGAIPRTAILLVTLGILAAILTAVAIGAQPSSKSELAPLFGLAGNGRLFTSRDGDIYVTEPDLSVAQPFKTSSQTELYPTMTNDGSHLLYQRDDGGVSAIMIAAADGSDEPRNLTPQPIASLGDWWPSPDGTLVSVVAPNGAVDNLTLIPTDGTASRSLPVGMSLTGAIWEPDGHHLQISRDAVGRNGAEIYRMSTDGGEPTLVRYLSGGVRWLGISPDGTRIAYATSPDPLGGNGRPPQAWIANVDGTDAHRLTDSDTMWEDGVFWSPDGKRLALTTWDGLKLRVNILAVDGGASAVVSDLISLSGPMATSNVGDASETIYPAWAPDGRSLLLWRSSDPGLLSVDTMTGAVTDVPGSSVDLPVWQRLAP